MSEKSKDGLCVFCEKAANPVHDRENFILRRARFNFVILNLYPYTTGHSMIIPYEHVRDLAGAKTETLAEMMTLAQQMQRALEDCYKPQGFNIGLNIGRSAGAGVDQHIHLHVLPRWTGDANFMTVIGETRIQPEDLAVTYEKLLPYFAE